MWPKDAREELAESTFEVIVGLEGQYHASGNELKGIDRGLEDVRQGRIATAGRS
jgi:hypothetical protein